MRKSKATIAAILLAASMMTACAGGQNAVTAIQGSVSQTAGTEAAAAASSAETSAEIKAETSAAAASAEAAGTGIPADAVTVKLTGTGAEISGAGAEFEDGTLKITKGGTYVLSGRLDGQILLETGRTHQIRVHFAHIGHPLAGDSLYGGGCPEIGRQALHCARLSFTDPLTGEKITVRSELPRDIRALFPEEKL